MPDATIQRPAWAGLRVALVHDWLTGMRGGEKVLESICRLFPDAPLYTLLHVPGSVSPLIESRAIHTSLIQRLPQAVRRYREYLPLFPVAIEQFDFDHVDLIISTSHCAAKSVVKTGRAVHLCYCHSPMRYAWDQFDAYFGPERLGRWPSALARQVMAWMARWDRDTAHRVDMYLANSHYVAGRIARYYNRRATVLHPPVDTDFFTPAGATPAPDFLVVSALVPYKRLDVAIDAANRAHAPLVVVGSGPDEARLRARAGATVTFAGSLEGDALRDRYRRARAVLLPGEEDFGIVPVEAMACGRPVIALGTGGATETVVPGVTGRLVEPGVEAFAAALQEFDDAAFDPAVIRAHAERFAAARFESAFAGAVTAALGAGAVC
ncbi:MAG TPA: glycosyltransferase [Vicinamibacterales bacterium]|nr:glycosyltransferase [Vicinamibacterales bacterium]